MGLKSLYEATQGIGTRATTLRVDLLTRYESKMMGEYDGFMIMKIRDSENSNNDIYNFTYDSYTSCCLDNPLKTLQRRMFRICNTSHISWLSDNTECFDPFSALHGNTLSWGRHENLKSLTLKLHVGNNNGSSCRNDNDCADAMHCGWSNCEREGLLIFNLNLLE